MFNFRRKKKLKSIQGNEFRFLKLLEKIEMILKINNNVAQANIVSRLLILLAHREFSRFQDELNSLEMWGGAGAVWEVHIDDSDLNVDFEKSIVLLIDLMQESQRLTRNLKRIRNIMRKGGGTLVTWDSDGTPI